MYCVIRTYGTVPSIEMQFRYGRIQACNRREIIFKSKQIPNITIIRENTNCSWWYVYLSFSHGTLYVELAVLPKRSSEFDVSFFWDLYSIKKI